MIAPKRFNTPVRLSRTTGAPRDDYVLEMIFIGSFDSGEA